MTCRALFVILACLATPAWAMGRGGNRPALRQREAYAERGWSLNPAQTLRDVRQKGAETLPRKPFHHVTQKYFGDANACADASTAAIARTFDVAGRFEHLGDRQVIDRVRLAADWRTGQNENQGTNVAGVRAIAQFLGRQIGTRTIRLWHPLGIAAQLDAGALVLITGDPFWLAYKGRIGEFQHGGHAVVATRVDRMDRIVLQDPEDQLCHRASALAAVGR